MVSTMTSLNLNSYISKGGKSTSNSKAKQFFATGKGDIFPPQFVKHSLINLQPVTGFSWWQTWYSRTTEHTQRIY